MTSPSDLSIQDNLKSVDRAIKRVQASAIIASDEEAIVELMRMKEALAVIAAKSKSELPRCEERKSLSRGLDIMHNTTASMIDLATQREVNEAQVREFLDANRRRIFKVSTLISSLMKRKGQPKPKKEEEEGSIVRPAPGESLLKSAEKDIAEFQHYRSLLPSSSAETKKAFIIARIPVIARIKPFVKPEVFEKAGIKVRALPDYHLAFENQLVLGVNIERIKEEKKKPDEFRKAVVKIISQKHNKPFTIMSAKNVPVKGTGFIYTWMMADSDLAKIARFNGGKGFAILEWGPAFR